MVTNPWLSRFSAFADLDEIKRRAQLEPAPFGDLGSLTTHIACERIASAFKDLFIVTPKIAGTLQVIGRHAEAGADLRYSDEKTILKNCYDDRYRPPIVPPLCLFGLAGICKTSVVSAAERVLRSGQTVPSLHGHEPIVLRGFVHGQMAQGDTDRTVLARVAESMGSKSSVVPKDREQLKRHVRAIAYRDGVAGLLLDEFQHATLSSANARLTSILLTMRETGIPLIFVCNYSLVHRLLKRPHEDRDRLLARVWHCAPEDPGSVGWTTIIAGTLRVLGPNAVLEAERDAEEIGELTGRLPRNMHRLFVLGYAVAREAGSDGIAMGHIRTAYHSRAYAAARNDVEELRQISQGCGWKRTKRADLVCPEEFNQNASPDAQCASSEVRDKQIARLMLEQAMTPAERQGRLIAGAQKPHKPDSRVIPIGVRERRTVQSLVNAHTRYEK